MNPYETVDLDKIDGYHRIFHLTDWHETYNALLNREDGKKVDKLISEKRYTVKDSDTTYRIINHWMSQGLLEDDREDTSKGWRKLALTEILWLRILLVLRRYGLPLEKLQNTYNSLFFFNGEHSLWWLKSAMALCLSQKPIQVFVVVFDDGKAAFASLKSLLFTDRIKGQAQSYIRINLNLLCCEMLGSNKYIPELEKDFELAEDEIDLINTIRTNEYDQVSLRLNAGHIEQIDTTKMVSGAQSISELLENINFGEVTFQVVKGKVAHTKTTKKTKKK